MLRIILRNTHNALLFACILLLLCSFERLCRYDFAQISSQANANLGEEGLQVDHFVFWGGIPAFESGRTKNPVRVGLSKFVSWASHYKPPILAAAPTSQEDIEMLVINSAASLSEANRIMKRQIRHSQRKQASSISESSKDMVASESVPTTSEPIAAPKVGFMLLLPSCNRKEISRWQKVWTEQPLDEPFLFHVLLPSTAEESCVKALQEELENTEEITYQISRNDDMAMSLQTCQNREGISFDGLDEFLYYDASKAVGRMRSSANLRRFQRNHSKQSSFQCTGKPQKPAFCDDWVMDCPWFQYLPSNETELSSQLPATTA